MSIPPVLLEHLQVLVTMNEGGEEHEDAHLFLENGRVTALGPGAAPARLRDRAELVLDGRGKIALPGLVNAHDHLYQSITRAVPEGQDAGLFDWLSALYPIWSCLSPEMAALASRVSMAELLLSGCTTTVDHTYVFPDPEASRHMLSEISSGARELGIRLQIAVGGATAEGVKSGGNPPGDELLELYSWAAEVLPEGDRVGVAIGPSSLFAVGKEFLGRAAGLATVLGVPRHTHLGESLDERRFSEERYGAAPVPVLEEEGWLENDVWIAHAVHVGPEEVERFAAGGVGVAHCPSSNMRLGSGIAPLRGYLDAGVEIGLGVDGSASNDGGHMLGEARQALLLARVSGGAGALTAREALRLATSGGARAIKRPDLGRLEPGSPADVAVFDLEDIALHGAEWDPVAALVLSWPPRAETVLCAGRVVVSGGQLFSADLDGLLTSQRQAAWQLMRTLSRA